MFSNKLLPAACEVDVTGALGMYAMMLASGKPSAILDWNNNYGDDPDKCVVFHCSNLPKDVFAQVCMSRQDILASTVGADNALGACVGRIKPGPFTCARVSTDDLNGRVRAYLGQGEITDDPLETFGGYGVVHVPNLQRLLRHICENGFEHHVAVNQSQVGEAVYEAMNNYLEWDVYYHQ
jgi:L-fucose isomerase-like protein